MSERRNISIILHSGAYDRVYHGLSIALTALAFGDRARILFTYWALEYVRKGEEAALRVEGSDPTHAEIIKKRLREGHLRPVVELIKNARDLRRRNVRLRKLDGAVEHRQGRARRAD